jgi:hypothetical protein
MFCLSPLMMVGVAKVKMGFSMPEYVLATPGVELIKLNHQPPYGKLGGSTSTLYSPHL